MLTETQNKMRAFKTVAKLMGNVFEFTIVSDDAEWAAAKTEIAITEVKRIETLLTTFNSQSQTNQINDYAGIIPVQVDAEVFALISRAQKISAITDGAFDLSYGSLDKRLWNFDSSMTELPDIATAKSMVRLINYKNIELNKTDSTVFLKEKGMRIGFGGIGKGYAAERVKAVLLKEDVFSALVNASGDLTAWGNQDDGEAWTVGISDPGNAKNSICHFNISGMAVATSGNYEKYVVINGKKYSHTINPKTGLPVTGIKSVTIISPDAEIADALATPVTIMGVKNGLEFINQLKQVECLIIDDNNKIFTSSNIHLR